VTISTRRGDGGETHLLGGRRVPKTHPRIAWVGALDELDAVLGWARSVAGAEPLPAEVDTAEGGTVHTWGALLRGWQVQLITAGGIAATPAGATGRATTLKVPPVAELDGWVERTEAVLPTFRGFVVPGDTPLGAALDLARTAVRRAERAGWAADQPEDPASRELLAWLNRLADVLWLLARLADAGKTA